MDAASTNCDIPKAFTGKDLPYIVRSCESHKFNFVFIFLIFS